MISLSQKDVVREANETDGPNIYMHGSECGIQGRPPAQIGHDRPAFREIRPIVDREPPKSASCSPSPTIIKQLGSLLSFTRLFPAKVGTEEVGNSNIRASTAQNKSSRQPNGGHSFRINSAFNGRRVSSKNRSVPRLKPISSRHRYRRRSICYYLLQCIRGSFSSDRDSSVVASVEPSNSHSTVQPR
jgi:hypothetical protein